MTTTATIAAKPAKLRTGAWGARTASPVEVGDIVTITTRAGKSWDARVEHVVWTDGTTAICATTSLDRPSQPRRAPTARSSASSASSAGLVGTTDGATGELRRRIDAGRGYRPDVADELGRTWRVGQRAGALAGKLVTCLGAEADYTSEDWEEDCGQPGIGAGWWLTLHVRPATDEESAPVLEREAERAAADERKRAEAESAKATWDAAVADAREGRAQTSVIPSVEDTEDVAQYEDGGCRWSLRRATYEGGIVYLLSSYSYDDWRSDLLGPVELVERVIDHFLAEHSITRGQALQWLGKYAGCYGRETYLRAAGLSITLDADAAKTAAAEMCAPAED